MYAQTNVTEAEKQVFRLATFEDGIWEIYLGTFFVLMSFYGVTRQILGPALNLVLILFLALGLAGLVWLGKKRLTQPRLGLVKFGSGTRQKIRLANLITWGLVIGTFALMILGSQQLLNEPTWERLPQWFRDFDVDLVFALLIVAFFSLIAHAVGLPRFYLYGALLGVGNFTATVLLVYYDVQFSWPVTLAGLIIAGNGVFLLLKFLQDHPLPAETTDERT